MSAKFSILGVLFWLALGATAGRAEDSPADLVEHGHYRRARPPVEARAAAEPRDVETLRLLSRIRMAFGDLEVALDLAERTVELDPKCARCHLQLADVCLQMASTEGKLKAMGLARRFKKEALLALSLDPQLTDAHWDLLEFYWRAPGMVGGGKDKARATVEALARIDGVEGLLAAVRLALLEKDTVQAEKHAQEAVQAAPKNYATHLQAGQLHAARRRWAQAEEEARAALALESDRIGPGSLLAIVEARAGRYSELDSALAGAERAVPDNPAPLYHAARWLIEERQELPRAEALLRRYLAREPEGFAPTHAHAHWRLGQALERQGKQQEAVAELETALRLKPDLGEAKKDLKRLRG